MQGRSFKPDRLISVSRILCWRPVRRFVDAYRGFTRYRMVTGTTEPLIRVLAKERPPTDQKLWHSRVRAMARYGL